MSDYWDQFDWDIADPNAPTKPCHYVCPPFKDEYIELDEFAVLDTPGTTSGNTETGTPMQGPN